PTRLFPPRSRGGCVQPTVVFTTPGPPPPPRGGAGGAPPPGRLLHGAQVLVGHALDGGGHDNVTVALLPFTFAPQGAGSA
ncbi:hypothetical protein ACFXA4_02270, partial [Streptomyces sp. NPDC059442]